MEIQFLIGFVIGVIASFASIDNFYRQTYKKMFETTIENYQKRIQQLKKIKGIQ